MCDPSGATGRSASGYGFQMPQGMTKPMYQPQGFQSGFQRQNGQAPLGGFDGKTQDMGNNLFSRQMGPSMLPDQGIAWGGLAPHNRFQPGRTDQSAGAKVYTPPSGQPNGSFQPPPPPNPYTPPPTTQPDPYKPPVTSGTPTMIPGVPEHLMNQITMDQGRMLYGPDKQAVKWDGTQLRFDDTPFNPGAGQFGQYGQPGAGGQFSGEVKNGMNYINNGNQSTLWGSQGLDSGGPEFGKFVDYLNSYRR